MRLVTLWGGIWFAVLCAAIPAITEGALAQTGRATNGMGTPFELSFWQSVDGSGDPAQYDEYLKQYPKGTFSALARVKIVSLRKNAEPPSAPVQPITEPSLATVVALPPPAFSRALLALAEGTPIAASIPIPMPAPLTAPVLVSSPPIPLPASSTASAQTLDLAALLAALASSQESDGPSAAARPSKAFTLPPRPPLVLVPEV